LFKLFLHNALVEFAFKDLSPTNAKVLQEKYGNNYNDPFEM